MAKLLLFWMAVYACYVIVVVVGFVAHDVLCRIRGKQNPYRRAGGDG